jgi:hypothetical protein
MRSDRWTRGALVAAGVLAAWAGPAAAADDLPPAIEQVGAAGPARPSRFEAALGFRSALLRSAGYDPFSTTDTFTQASLHATWSFLERGRWATAVGPLFERGSTSALARGIDADLALTRLGALVEERWSPHPRARVFARLAPAWLSGSARLLDRSLPAPLGTSFHTLSVDASAGAAARLNLPSSSVGFWFAGETGYGWAATQAMTFSPELPKGDAQKAGTTTFADLAPRGVFFRFVASVTF